MYVDCDFHSIALAAYILREGSLLDAPMHSSLFGRLQCRCLRVGKPRLRVAFRKRPAATARFHEQEVNVVLAHSITDSSHLLGPAKPAQVLDPEEPRDPSVKVAAAHRTDE